MVFSVFLSSSGTFVRNDFIFLKRYGILLFKGWSGVSCCYSFLIGMGR